MRRLALVALLFGLAAPLASAAEGEWEWEIPDDMTVEAQRPEGAIVTFVVRARYDGEEADVTCDPPSGSIFRIRRTDVDCEAKLEEEDDREDFRITVRDTTGPVLTLPANITVETSDPTGAVVTFTASASDVVDGPRPISCNPPSGTHFAHGTSRVNCSASDTRGNSTTGGFDITVTFPRGDPRITVPPDMTVEATSFAGAVVTYTASAVDRRDRPIPVSCNPPSGATFPLGTTTVTCTATDDGETEAERFKITVADRTMPVLTIPANKNLRTTRRLGVVVKFTASAIDAVDGGVVTTCTPPSGSLFSRGATVVTCVAGDRRGNVAVGKFTISVALVRAVRSASALFAPQAGARVRGTSVLRWRAVRKARFYNVQVYRNGRKILSRWPKRPRMRLGRSWTYQGRRFRLKRGVYVWYVWPAFGVPANPRYGKMLGGSSFRVV